MRARSLTLHFTRRRKGQEIETIYERNQEWLLGSGERRAVSGEQGGFNYQLFSVCSPLIAHCSPLEGVIPALVIANADGFVDSRAEDFAISDFAGLRRTDDGALDLLHHIIANDHLDLDFRTEVDGVLAAAVNLGVALLAAMSADFDDGHTLNANVVQSVLYGFQLRCLNDGFN